MGLIGVEKVKYTCKECGCLAYATDLEEILKLGKLCRKHYNAAEHNKNNAGRERRIISKHTPNHSNTIEILSSIDTQANVIAKYDKAMVILTNILANNPNDCLYKNISIKEHIDLATTLVDQIDKHNDLSVSRITIMVTNMRNVIVKIKQSHCKGELM